MRNETAAVHSRNGDDSATRDRAVPIYPTFAYGFDAADDGAARAAASRRARALVAGL